MKDFSRELNLFNNITQHEKELKWFEYWDYSIALFGQYQIKFINFQNLQSIKRYSLVHFS